MVTRWTREMPKPAAPVEAAKLVPGSSVRSSSRVHVEEQLVPDDCAAEGGTGLDVSQIRVRRRRRCPLTLLPSSFSFRPKP